MHLKGVEETPLLWLYNSSTTALLSPIYSHLYDRPYKRFCIVFTNGFALSLQTALQTALQRLYNGSVMSLQRLNKWLCNGSTNGSAMAL